MSFGGSAVSLQSEEIISTRYVFAITAFTRPLGSDKFGELCTSNSGSLNYAFPGVGEVSLFAGYAPGFEPALIAPQYVGVGLIDGFL